MEVGLEEIAGFALLACWCQKGRAHQHFADDGANGGIFNRKAARRIGCQYLEWGSSSLAFQYQNDTILNVPRKIRQLIKDLEKAGFVDRGGKGSHRNFVGPNAQRVTVSGKLGDDARNYQEKLVEIAIKESKRGK